VRAVNKASTASGPWSNSLDFTVMALGTPTPIGPGGTLSSAQATFTWSEAAGADHYDVWVGDLTTGQTVLRNQKVVGTTWTFPPLHRGDSYRWWVRAVNSTNTATSSWSNYLDFTIAALAAPTLIGPAGSMTTAAPTFSWNAVSGADHYDVWVDDLTTGQ